MNIDTYITIENKIGELETSSNIFIQKILDSSTLTNIVNQSANKMYVQKKGIYWITYAEALSMSSSTSECIRNIILLNNDTNFSVVKAKILNKNSCIQ